MKKGYLYIVLSLCLLMGSASLTSCSRKSGCPAEEATVKIKKNQKRGTTSLWGKQQRKNKK